MDPSSEEGSSSSSISILSPPNWEYDVFVSFRGADTRNKFTSHLLKALENEGYRTFRDDRELERGEYISIGLRKAVEGSRMSLIVFSKDYAGSMWCLDELVRIMDCKKTLNQIVVPIFYDIVPSDMGKQDLQKAFAKHQKKYSGEQSDGKVVEKWKKALIEAAEVAGHHLLNDSNGDEAAFIEKIIKDVREKVPIHLKEPDHQVGLERRVEKLIDLLKMEFIGVRFVAIWGMGGIGKTTTAISLYNRIRHMFERSGFLVDVRDTSQRFGWEELQRKLLLVILKGTREVSNFHEGIEVIKKTAFVGKKVLLVLDDVDDDEQLKTLAINRDFFAPGSRIIITTRNKYLLKNLELGEDEIYELEELDKDESLELFSWHAFKVDHPSEDLLDCSRQIGHFAGGLPLALKVLGSYFIDIPQGQWESELAKLRKEPDADVQENLHKILKMSFDSLSEQLKKLFLDIAYFFVGMGRDFTVKILEGRNRFAENGIRKLADRCLIKFDFRAQIVMHDMIREMGREIVKQESPEDPGKRSRLCDPDDVRKVLRDDKGTEAIKGLILNGIEVQEIGNPLGKKMDKPWYRKHVFKVRRDGMILDKLKFLYLSHCHYLTRTPNFSGLYSLEELLLNDCKSLVEVDKSIRCLNKLLVLDMKNCIELQKLPPGIWMLKSLKHLDLSGCSKLGSVAGFKGPLHKLRCLFFSYSTLSPKGVNSIGLFSNPVQASSCLKELNLGGCHLSDLPDEIGNLISLQTLDLAKNNLSILPDGIYNLTCLEHLRLEDNNVSHLPNGIGRLTSLKLLNLERNSLCTLPDTIGKLSSLNYLFLGYNNLSNLPSEIGDLESLEDLRLGGNSGLCDLPESICRLDCLLDLILDNCNLSRLPSGIGGLVSLEYLIINQNNNICTIPDSISKLLCLQCILLNDCENLRSLPELPGYTYVGATACPSLESIPLELEQLGQKVNYSGCIKLAEQNFLTSLLKQLPKSKGLSEVQHFVNVVVLPGDQDRFQFPDHGRGPKVCFEVPPSPSVKQKMLGWILRLLVNRWIGNLMIYKVVCNKIKGKVWIPTMFGLIPDGVDLVWLLYIPQGYEGLQLEAGNEVEIPIHGSEGPPKTVVKNWAIDFIYEADEIHKGTETFNQVVTI